MNTVRIAGVILCVAVMFPFVIVGTSITLLGYPFAVLGSLLGDGEVMTVYDYIEMIN